MKTFAGIPAIASLATVLLLSIAAAPQAHAQAHKASALPEGNVNFISPPWQSAAEQTSRSARSPKRAGAI
jgi:hypothetical protein